MASATITTHTPITSYSHAKSVDAGHNRSFSTVTGGYEDDASQSIHPPGANSQLPTNLQYVLHNESRLSKQWLDASVRLFFQAIRRAKRCSEDGTSI
jgi:hypothetical protein